jgi:hypothetical protein
LVWVGVRAGLAFVRGYWVVEVEITHAAPLRHGFDGQVGGDVVDGVGRRTSVEFSYRLLRAAQALALAASTLHYPDNRIACEPPQMAHWESENDSSKEIRVMIARKETMTITMKQDQEELIEERVGQQQQPERGQFRLQVDRQTNGHMRLIKLPRR